MEPGLAPHGIAAANRSFGLQQCFARFLLNRLKVRDTCMRKCFACQSNDVWALSGSMPKCCKCGVLYAFGNERYYDFGMDALVLGCARR